MEEKVEKIVSEEPSKFWEESDERLMAKEYSERHQDVSGNLGKYLVQAVFIDGYQTAQQQMYSEEEVKHLMTLAFEQGFKKADIVEAGLEAKETDTEVNWIFLKHKK